MVRTASFGGAYRGSNPCPRAMTSKVATFNPATGAMQAAVDTTISVSDRHGEWTLSPPTSDKSDFIEDAVSELLDVIDASEFDIEQMTRLKISVNPFYSRLLGDIGDALNAALEDKPYRVANLGIKRKTLRHDGVWSNHPILTIHFRHYELSDLVRGT